MALGNNLKRTKKDSLLPDKKKKGGAKEKVKFSSKSIIAEKKAKTAKPVKSPKAMPKAIEPRRTANLEEKVLFGGKKDSPMTAKLFPSRRKAVRKTKLVLTGSLTLGEAEPLKDCLHSTFNDYDLIDIQLENITQLDLIPVQLIKTFVEYYPDKKVKVDSDIPFDMKIIIERAGFGSLMFKEEAA